MELQRGVGPVLSMGRAVYLTLVTTLWRKSYCHPHATSEERESARRHVLKDRNAGQWKVWTLRLRDASHGQSCFPLYSVLFTLFHKPFWVLSFAGNAFFRRRVGYRRDRHKVHPESSRCCVFLHWLFPVRFLFFLGNPSWDWSVSLLKIASRFAEICLLVSPTHCFLPSVWVALRHS